ncbi:nucleotide-binding alpha-beta plait domain-containing protein [Tanacetum coccineum]
MFLMLRSIIQDWDNWLCEPADFFYAKRCSKVFSMSSGGTMSYRSKWPSFSCFVWSRGQCIDSGSERGGDITNLGERETADKRYSRAIFGNNEFEPKYLERKIKAKLWRIIEASLDFTVEGRIAWVEVEGIPFKLWSGNSFSRIASKWGKLLDVDDQEDSCFHSKRLCIHTKSGNNIREEFKVIHRGKAFWIRANETQGWVPDFNDELDDEEDQDDIKSNDDTSDLHKMDSTGDNSEGEEVPDTIFEDDGVVKSRAEGELKDKNVDISEDPFNIYSLLNKNKHKNGNVNNSGSSLKYPPGFTPSIDADEEDVSVVDGSARNDETERGINKGNFTDAFSDGRDKCNSNENGVDSKASGHFKHSERPRTGGSIIGLLDEVVRVGQIMGYKMEGVISNMTEIIESQGVDDGLR